MIRVLSYTQGTWHNEGAETELYSAITQEPIATLIETNLNYSDICTYAREKGGPALRAMTIHERAFRIKFLARYLIARKEEFYTLSTHTGATRRDSWIDIEGGIGTLFTLSSKARQELSDLPFHVEGSVQRLSRGGTFVGQHICVPKHGVAIHINAFNFPVWGMLEKMAPAIIAGMPCIVKPSPVGSYLAHAVFSAIIESGLLPDGAVQFLAANKPGDLLDHLISQDSIAFTGSAHTGLKLKAHPNVIARNIPFNLEADSLNGSILGPDVTPDMEEFGLFVREVVSEMTVKSGQKCTAIRRTIVPEDLVEDVIEAMRARLETVVTGDPHDASVKMGPLASREQGQRFREQMSRLEEVTDTVYGSSFLGFRGDTRATSGHGEGSGNAGDVGDAGEVGDAGAVGSSLMEARVLLCRTPLEVDEVHTIEAFGPMTTILPYKTIDEAIRLANRAEGSLVCSLFTNDDDVAREITLGCAPWHGRFMVINRDSAGESTGHGSPMPHMVHGGPGRAGGGEELGGARSVLHHMQRVALQGSPTTLSHIVQQYIRGAKTNDSGVHPFRKYFEDVQIGESLTTHRRTITEADITLFGGLSGDYFYAHFDEIAAKDSLFGRRVAHGYFVLSAAAGMFVDPAPGPVLLNYGLEELRFTAPVYPGDTIQTKLIARRKTNRQQRETDRYPYGMIWWDVEVRNQDDTLVAEYTILTLVRRREALPMDEPEPPL